MSDKRVSMRERSLRYRRRMSGKDRGVSPVVATLILILIAVAAAAALYLWLVAWQGNVTAGIGQPTPQYTMTVGGSTSVYPFSSVGAQWFEQNNSNIVISDNQGGTGAGMLAVCQGHIDVGAASSPQTVTGLQTSDGCPASAQVTITTIAYDAVDVAIASSNYHGLLSINYDTLNLIYEHASTAGYTPITTLNGVPPPTGYPAAGSGSLQWGQIPAAVNGATIGVLGTEQIESAGVGVGGAACAAPFGNDVCAVTFGTTVTPCGWSVCAGGTVAQPATNNIVPVMRSDASGTTQTFEAKLLGYTSATAWATTFAGLGYSGCGSNNLLADCNLAVPTTGNGNPGVVTAVAGNPNAIGYASDGLVRASGSGVSYIPFLAVGQITVGSTGLAYGGVNPTTGATGTIAAGITGSTTVNQYSGWRPFEFVTLNPPTGEVERFFQFLLDPANNINLATATGEVSIYSV